MPAAAQLLAASEGSSQLGLLGKAQALLGALQPAYWQALAVVCLLHVDRYDISFIMLRANTVRPPQGRLHSQAGKALHHEHHHAAWPKQAPAAATQSCSWLGLCWHMDISCNNAIPGHGLSQRRPPAARMGLP